MPSAFKAGLSGGAAANNINLVQWYLGRTLVRATVVKAGTNAARTVLTRTAETEVTKINAYTLKTS